jgi:hypothetical protein
MKHLFTTILLAVASVAAMAQTGTWKAYVSYYEPTEIEQAANNVIYVLASNGLYSYNTSDQSLQTYDKTTVLNDCDIAHIAWCQQARRLVIVYANGNIDLLAPNSDVTNVADYMNATMTSDKTVNSICVSGSRAYLATGFGIVVLNVSDGTIANTYQLGFNVNYCYLSDNYLYAASSAKGLYRGSLSDNLLDKTSWTRVGAYVDSTKTMDPDLLATVKTLSPGGPQVNDFWFMRFINGQLYTTAGGWGHLIDGVKPGNIQVLNGDSWTIYQNTGIKEQTGIDYRDVNCLSVDPKDATHVMAGAKSGVYEFRNGQFVRLWNDANSPIEAFDGSTKGYEIISALTYDTDGNLWCFNSQCFNRSLLEYTGSEWVTHDKSAFMTKTDEKTGRMKSAGSMECMFEDSRGLLWMVNNYWEKPALYCYQPSTDAMNSYTSFVNEDGTTVGVTYARCVAEDKSNNIWMGTTAGPLMLTASDIANGTTTFTQVKVPRNDGTDYADYLLTGVDVSCIAVDKANRKWFGTYGSGVYCIGSDNITQVHHFTASNSKLFSDNIESIAINDNTGEVYIGTDEGLCSYMSDANTAAEGMTKNTVWAYPNPVKPDYTGAITIVGLEEDADVKIVTSNGTLVEEGRASSGEYKWYGLDKNMKRVASGVYMVEVATSAGEKGVVCKIAVVN